MELTPSKPYFIELFSAPNVPKNKFKFVLSAKTVLELKTLIKEKLIAKNEMTADSQLALKDTDDFELASDDELNDVLPDAKVRVYPKNSKANQAPVLPQLTSPAIPLPPPAASQPPQSIPVGPVVSNSSNNVANNTILDLSKLTIPMLGPEIKTRLICKCPQIRKTPIELPFDPATDSFLALSAHIVGALGLDPSLKAIPYNKQGQPLFYNLDLMHRRLPKFDFSSQLFIVFTATPSTTDQPVVQPATVAVNPVSLTVLQGGEKHTVTIDLSNTLSVLKYYLFKMTGIHPSNQILKFANKVLANPIQTLSSYNVAANSILELSFKLNSNLVPCTFADKFYYKDIQHTRKQSDNSITELRSNLLVLAAHLLDDDKIRFTSLVRAITGNLPLVFGLKCLLNNNFVSQCHRIAIEQGLLQAVEEYLKSCTPMSDTLQYEDIFVDNFRYFLGFLLEGIKKMANLAELKEQEEDVEVQVNCHFTIKPIQHPRLIKCDNGEYVLVDREQMQEQILKGFTFPLLKAPKREQLFAPKDLEEFYFQYHLNQLDNPNTNALYWIGFQDQPQLVNLPPYATCDKYKSSVDSYVDMAIHQPLEIKNKSSSYLLLRTKEQKLRVFVSKNKDIARPHNIFNVLTGEEEAVNLDLLSANVRSQNVEEAIDLSSLKAVITRPPKEAIAVLFDISGSMGGGFFNQPDLKRIGAVKSFFEAFAYRTIAYNLEHVVSLFFFDSVVENQCGFTEAIYDFNRLIAKAAPRGSTLLYDAIVVATKSLKELKAKYPECLLRILALTDGEDTGSKHSIEETTRLLVENGIIIDSFAVGANCEGLKVISKASGGKCYLTRHLEESLKLFEQETVLSVRVRKLDPVILSLPLYQRVAQAKLQPFDLPNNVHQFNLPEAKGGLNAKQALKKLKEQQSKGPTNASLKRISREIQVYSDNPHPFVSIYPCANINLWKILLLGPKETPYENGLFMLYAQFPGDYPFKAPEVRFITPIYHCNMNSQGRICHSVFDRNYSPALTFRQIVDCVYGLILTPEPQDPLDNVVASFFLSDYPTYVKNAKAFTKEKASPSIQQIVEELFGKIVDDGERKQKEQEIEEWIKLAKSFN